MKFLFFLLISGLTGKILLTAQELAWPQFRGPNCNGLASEGSIPPVEFNEDQNLKWKVVVPEGVSSPVIWGDHLYLTVCNEDSSEILIMCFNRHTGSRIWTRSLFPKILEGAHPISSPAQSTPAVDDKGLYVFSASFGLKCYDHRGVIRWESDLRGSPHRWGQATSPVVMDDKVILNLDYGGEDVRSLVALNMYSGEIEWRTFTQKVTPFNGMFHLGYATPVRYKDQIILHRMLGAASYELEDGSPVWWMPVITTGTSTPVVADSTIYFGFWIHYAEEENIGEYFDYRDYSRLIMDFDRDADHLISWDEIPEDMTFMSRIEIAEMEGATVGVRRYFGVIDSDHNQEVDSLEWKQMFDSEYSYFAKVGIAALNAEHKGEIMPQELRWMHSEKIAEVASPVFVEGYVYTVKDGGWVTCINAESGKVIYSERLGSSGAYLASPVAANGFLYIAGHRGIINVVRANGSPEVVSENRLQGKILATPAIAGNTIYIRTSEYLYAFSENP